MIEFFEIFFSMISLKVILYFILFIAGLWLLFHIPIWIFHYKVKLLDDIIDDESSKKKDKIKKILLFDFLFHR